MLRKYEFFQKCLENSKSEGGVRGFWEKNSYLSHIFYDEVFPYLARIKVTPIWMSSKPRGPGVTTAFPVDSVPRSDSFLPSCASTSLYCNSLQHISSFIGFKLTVDKWQLVDLVFLLRNFCLKTGISKVLQAMIKIKVLTAHLNSSDICIQL